MEITEKQNVVLIDRSIDERGLPNQRLFKTKAAARYLGIHPQTLRKYTDEGKLVALNLVGSRVYDLEELDRFITSLPEWYYGGGERSEASNGEHDGNCKS
jgi:Helix-turn-helix domain